MLLGFLSGCGVDGPIIASEGWQCDRTPILLTDVRLPGSELETALLIAEGAVQWIGRPEEAPTHSTEARTLSAVGATVLPGLIDSHTHFDALPAAKHLQAELDVQTEIFPITMRQTLASGVTRARAHLAALEDMAVMREHSRDACFPSPRISLGGPGLLGGAPGVENRLMRGVSGVDDARDKMEELAYRGAEWVALHGLSRFQEDELAVITEVAAEAGMEIMADTDSFDDLRSALVWPVRSAEYLNRSTEDVYPADLLSAIRARQTPLFVSPPVGYYRRSFQYFEAPDQELDPVLFSFVDDSIAIDMRESFEDAFQSDAYVAGAVASYPTHAGKLEQLRDAGALLVVGSDAGSLGQFHHDAIWREMDALVAMGVDPTEALAAATRVPAELLGLESEGRLSVGSLADIVLYAGEPELGDLRRAHVFAVIKGGVIYVWDHEWVGPSKREMVHALSG